jgi:hypothetical protein
MDASGRFQLFALLKFMPDEWQLCADKAVHCEHTQVRYFDKTFNDLMYWFYAMILWSLYPLLSNKRLIDTYCILHWAKVLLITYFSKTMA